MGGRTPNHFTAGGGASARTPPAVSEEALPGGGVPPLAFAALGVGVAGLDEALGLPWDAGLGVPGLDEALGMLLDLALLLASKAAAASGPGVRPSREVVGPLPLAALRPRRSCPGSVSVTPGRLRPRASTLAASLLEAW